MSTGGGDIGPEGAVDSRQAAREIARLLLIAIAIGVLAGIATLAFIAADHFGVEFLWTTLPGLVPGVPSWAVSVGVVAVMTMLASAVVAFVGARPFDMGAAEAEYDHEGRMDYRRVGAGTLFSLFSLFSGAPVGPEAPLTDINGGLGTFVAEKLKLPAAQVKTMTYAGVAGAFSAFFGVAPVGAVLAAELISPKALSISRVQVVSGLGAGAAGWVAYSALGGHTISPVLVFPGVETVTMADLAMAAVLGIAGGVIGLAYGKGLMTARLRLQSVRSKPWLAALVGGVPVAVAAVAAPYLLFSGQSEMPRLIEEAAALGVIALVALGVGKLALSGWSLSSAYFGGPIFPVIFAGTCFGLALSIALPIVPQGVAVVAIVTGMTVAAAVAPLSVTLFISMVADPVLAPSIAIAAVFAFAVRQLLAPTLPGIYRATHAKEAAAAREA